MRGRRCLGCSSVSAALWAMAALRVTVSAAMRVSHSEASSTRNDAKKCDCVRCCRLGVDVCSW